MIPSLAALLAWPVVAVVLFQRLRLPLAAIVTVLAGYLLLPTQTAIDPPFLPALDRDSVPILAALVFVVLFAGPSGLREFSPGLLPRSRVAVALVLMALGGAFLTVLTNGDPVTYGPQTLPGLRLYDGFSEALGTLILLLPLLLGRKLLAQPAEQRLLLVALVVAGLLYSMLALYEIRMSPQINQMVYGFFPHQWAQHVRAGGFRPLVFLPHGLWLAIFFSGCAFAAFGLWRAVEARRGLYFVAGLWLLGTLVLGKSLGAIIITFLLLPVIIFLRIRLQLVFAFGIGAILLFYPMLRAANMVPVDHLLAYAEQIDPERAASFATRLHNEELMLAKAEERAIFGWGGWGRSRVVDERGVDISIADGYWVIVIGVRGWVGYLGTVGLLAGPLFFLLLRYRHVRPEKETAILALILAGNMIDLIPNATITPLTWLLAGALWGRLEIAGQKATAGKAAVAIAPASPPRFRRSVPTGSAPPEGSEDGGKPPDAGRPAYTRQTEPICRTRKPSSD